VIIGNKIDLVDARQISKEQATQKAEELNVLYMEVSALSGENIKDLFDKIA
jgi:GTPase SAR1 family protein